MILDHRGGSLFTVVAENESTANYW